MTEKGRVRTIEWLRRSAQQKYPPEVVLCRPENEAEVREIVAESGVDITVAAHPEAHSYMAMPNRPYLESQFPELARQLRGCPREPQEPETVPEKEGRPPHEVRIVLYWPEERKTVRVETGPGGTEVHLDG